MKSPFLGHHNELLSDAKASGVTSVDDDSQVWLLASSNPASVGGEIDGEPKAGGGAAETIRQLYADGVHLCERQDVGGRSGDQADFHSLKSAGLRDVRAEIDEAMALGDLAGDRAHASVQIGRRDLEELSTGRP